MCIGIGIIAPDDIGDLRDHLLKLLFAIFFSLLFFMRSPIGALAIYDVVAHENHFNEGPGSGRDPR